MKNQTLVTLRAFVIWLLCIGASQNAHAYGALGCDAVASFSNFPSGTYGVDWVEAYHDCVCEVNDGFYYSGDFLGHWTISPFDWDFKLASTALCPDHAPDCSFSISIGPIEWGLGCGSDDDDDDD